MEDHLTHSSLHTAGTHRIQQRSRLGGWKESLGREPAWGWEGEARARQDHRDAGEDGSLCVTPEAGSLAGL